MIKKEAIENSFIQLDSSLVTSNTTVNNDDIIHIYLINNNFLAFTI